MTPHQEALLKEAGLLYVVKESEASNRLFIAASGDFIERLFELIAEDHRLALGNGSLTVAAFEYTRLGQMPALSYTPFGIGAQAGFQVEPLYRVVPSTERHPEIENVKNT
jgi:hypothetical protein